MDMYCISCFKHVFLEVKPVKFIPFQIPSYTMSFNAIPLFILPCVSVMSCLIQTTLNLLLNAAIKIILSWIIAQQSLFLFTHLFFFL